MTKLNSNRKTWAKRLCGTCAEKAASNDRSLGSCCSMSASPPISLVSLEVRGRFPEQPFAKEWFNPQTTNPYHKLTVTRIYVQA